MIVVSIDPIIAKVGGWILTWHGLLMAYGFGVTYILAARLGKRNGIAPVWISELAIWCIVACILCARLGWALDQFSTRQELVREAVLSQGGGLTSAGGMVGLLGAVLIVARMKKIPALFLLDLIFSVLPAGAVIGRLGCLIQGDILGLPTGSSWGLVYTHPSSSVPASLLGVATFPVVPVFIFSFLAIGGVFALIQKSHPPPGFYCAAFLVLYGLDRVVVGFWQAGDVIWAGLKTFQISGIVFMTIGLVGWGWLIKQVSRLSRPVSGV